MPKKILFWFVIIFLFSYSYSYSYSSSYSFDSSFPLHAPKSSSFSYDANGNLQVLPNGNKLVYNQDNRLVEVKDSAGKTIQKNVYDYTGQRIKKTDYTPSGTITTYYHIPGVEIEVIGDKTTITRYLPNGVIQKLTDQENKIYQTYQDHLSSVKVITDESGNKIENGEIDYYPYGQVKNSDQLITDRLYTNQINDYSTNLYYYNARFYDPALGIFTSPDQAQGPNRYAYVGGNPINRNDPSGNDPITIKGIPLRDWFFYPNDPERRAAVDRASSQWYDDTYNYGQENYSWAYRENWSPTLRTALDTAVVTASLGSMAYQGVQILSDMWSSSQISSWAVNKLRWESRQETTNELASLGTRQLNEIAEYLVVSGDRKGKAAQIFGIMKLDPQGGIKVTATRLSSIKPDELRVELEVEGAVINPSVIAHIGHTGRGCVPHVHLGLFSAGSQQSYLDMLRHTMLYNQEIGGHILLAQDLARRVAGLLLK